MMLVDVCYSKSLHTVTTVDYINNFCAQGATSYRCQNSTSAVEIGEERPGESSTLIGNNII